MSENLNGFVGVMWTDKSTIAPEEIPAVNAYIIEAMKAKALGHFKKDVSIPNPYPLAMAFYDHNKIENLTCQGIIMRFDEPIVMGYEIFITKNTAMLNLYNSHINELFPSKEVLHKHYGIREVTFPNILGVGYIVQFYQFTTLPIGALLKQFDGALQKKAKPKLGIVK